MIDFAYATGDAAAATQTNAWVGIIPWIAIFALMYFMMIRPQQKREKERQAMIDKLQKGDRVLLVSGFYGKIIKSGAQIFTIELGKNLQVEVERNAIAALVPDNQTHANPTNPTNPSNSDSENKTN